MKMVMKINKTTHAPERPSRLRAWSFAGCTDGRASLD
jgi:hypothetical protein